MKTSLIALNAFRSAEGQVPFAEWRKARHESMLERYEDEYEVATMNLLADLADEDPDGYADDQADAAIDENNEASDSMDDPPDALLIDETTGETIRESELVAQQETKARNEAVQEIAKTAKLPSYKQILREHGGTSKIENPVAFVHGFLDANPNMTRKQAVSALVSVHGVNYSTARTQFQKWYTKHKATAETPEQGE